MEHGEQNKDERPDRCGKVALVVAALVCATREAFELET